MLRVYSQDNQVVTEHVLAYEREYFVDTAKSPYWNCNGRKTKKMICTDKIWEICYQFRV